MTQKLEFGISSFVISHQLEFGISLFGILFIYLEFIGFDDDAVFVA
jgi:hypothetical protein